MSLKYFFGKPQRDIEELKRKEEKLPEFIKNDEKSRMDIPNEFKETEVETKRGTVDSKYPRRQGELFGDEEHDYGPWYRPQKPVVRKEKKDAVVFVVEESLSTVNYKKEILWLINKIIESNKECFFVLLCIGTKNKFYDPIDYNSFKVDGILSKILDESQEQSIIDYVEALKHIATFYDDTIFDFKYKEKEYDIEKINIIFIGTGHSDTDNIETSKIIKKLKLLPRTKTIKYFCLEDNQTFNAAQLGMPVIGHVITDFYK